MEKPSHDALGDRKSSMPIDSSPLLEKSHTERSSGLFGLLRSPFQAAAKTVRLLASPREASLAGHSPGPKKHIPQHPPAVTQSQNVYQQAAKTAKSEPAVPPPSDVISQKEQEGWSPSKLESLKYFLSQPPASSQPLAPEAAHPRAPASLVTEQDKLPEIRPYLGLKYLLRSGPTESGVPKSWERLQMPLLDERRKTSQAPARAGPSSARYAPYALPPSGANRLNARPPPQLPAPHQQLAVRGRGPLPLTPYPHAPQNESVAASGHALVSPAAIPRLTPPGSVPKSLTTAASYAPFSGTPPTRAGTPLQQGAGQSNGTPMPRKLFQGPPSLVNTPLTGGGLSAVGMKRGRSEAGSGSVTPLMGSGITNLAEYKRQRQRYSSENRSLLSMGAGGGSASRSVSRTVSPDGSAPVHQQQQQEGLLLPGEDFTTTPALSSPPAKPVTATTDTARRILQTLDNMSKVHDQQLQSPAPTPSNTMPSKGPAGSTPFPRYNAPPPLDRLSPVQLSSPSPSPSPAMFKTSVQEQKQQKSVFEPLVAEEEGVLDTQPFLSVAPAAASASASWRHQDVGVTQATVDAPPFSFSNQASTPAFTFSASPPVAYAPAPSLLTVNGVKEVPKTGIQEAHLPSQHHLVSEADTLTQPAKKVFTFGLNTQDETSKALAAVLNDVPVASGMVIPKFVFGDAEVTVTATTPQSTPMGADKISFPAKTYIDMKEQVTAASQIPLPPEEDEQVDAVVHCNEKVMRKEARQAASPHNSNSVETATPASRISQSDKPSEAPAPAVSSGWGASFLAANQAALSSANQAVAQDIAASQSPAPAASVAAAPAGSGWGAAFLAQNQSQLSQATAAVEAEVEAAKKPASSVEFTFGVTPSSTVQEKAGPTGTSAASVEGAAPIQAPLKEAVAASGWDLGFLQKSQAALASASEAVANEIQETQQGGVRKEAASPIVSGFGSPFPTTRIDTPSLQTNPAASLLPPFTFGAPSNAATASVSTAAASPAFAFTSSSAPAAETPAPAPFSFGAPTSSAASFAPTSAPAASFSFSSSSSSMATAAVEPSTAVSTPAASFLFGAAASSSSAFTFGATNISAQTSTTQPSFFGSTPATALPTSEPSTSAFPSTTFTFGASQPASQQAPPVQQQQPNTSTSLFSFGAQPTSQPQAPSFINNPVNPPAPSSLFGQPSAAPSSSSQAWPSNPPQALAATPAFASPFFQSTTPSAISTPPFGNQLQTDGASIFGNPQSSPAPAFGFGASTPTFMNTPTSPAPNTFGQPGHTPFVFGQANASPLGSASPLPSFQTQQQPNSFTFGGAPAAPPAPIFGAPTSGFGAVSAPTGFGATPSMPAFGAPFQTAPSAGLGAVGDGANGVSGFTLGTGNSEPTGRRRIKAKRNNG